MKTKLIAITLLIFAGLLLTSFQSSHDGPMTGPEVILSTTADALGVQLMRPETVAPDRLTNYPDPFCGLTTIEYEIIHPTWVNLMISCPDNNNFSLVFRYQPAGTYTVTFDACDRPCGRYYVTMMTYYDTEIEVMNKIRSVIKPKPIAD